MAGPTPPPGGHLPPPPGQQTGEQRPGTWRPGQWQQQSYGPQTDAVPKAGFGSRFAALLIDSLVAMVLALPAIILWFAAPAEVEPCRVDGSGNIAVNGKRALNIRTVDQYSVQPIGPGRAIGRYFARILSGIPCWLGYLWMLWDPQRQTWHDKLAGSVVVKG